MIKLSITSNALGVVGQLAGFQAVLASHLLEAEKLSLDAVQNEAVNYMFSTFQAPTGQLEGAFYQVIEEGIGSIEGQLINPESYAWRRERGFSGMTDSLGRFFPDDPGIAYMEHSLDDQIPTIEQYFSDALDATITEMGGTP